MTDGAVRRRFPVEGPLDLPRTVAALATWGTATWQRVDGETAWYADRMDSGPATVRLIADGAEVDAQAFGDGAEELLQRVPALLGLDRPPPAPIDGPPILRDASRRFAGVRHGRTGRVFPALVSVILAQKVTGQESAQASRRLARAWGERAPGPREDLWLSPAPDDLRRRSYAELHPLGVERRRAEVLLEVAARARRLERAAELDHQAADTLLRHVRGVGPWTTGVVLGDALGHEDAFPLGDWHLPNAVAFVLAGEPRADDARLLELLEPWRGRRGRVVRLLTLAGAQAPRWGPRSEIREYRDF